MKTFSVSLPKVCLVLAVIVFLFSGSNSFRSFGLDEGLQIAENEYDKTRTQPKIEFAVHGPRTYEGLASSYGWIALLTGNAILFCLILCVKKVDNNVKYFSSITGLLLVLPAINICRTLIRDKDVVGVYFFEDPRNAFAKATIVHDWILLICLSVIFVLLLLWMMSTYFKSRHNKA